MRVALEYEEGDRSKNKGMYASVDIVFNVAKATLPKEDYEALVILIQKIKVIVVKINDKYEKEKK